MEMSESRMSELENNQGIIMSRKDKEDWKTATNCYTCGGGNFTETSRTCKVRDHCHRTGCYRGAAHNRCNTNYFNNKYLPIFSII